MSLEGRVNRLAKSLSNRPVGENTTSRSGDSFEFDLKKRQTVIIEATNTSGDKLSAYTCVVLTDADDIPNMTYPAAQDDKEITQYGSLLEDTLSGEVGHVQISGEMIYRLKSGSELLVIGEILYPLANVTGKKGKVTSKANADSDRINIPLGRVLQSEGSDTDLVIVNGSGVGGSSGGDVEVADYVMTSNVVSKSGNPTIDNASSALVAGDIVFLQNQNTATENGLYTIPTGGGNWTLTNDAPDVVFVKKGGNNRLSIWIKGAANTFYRYDNTAKYTSTSNRASLSGTTTTGLDTTSAPSVGDLVLLKDQTTATERGLYLVQSGTWIKLGQPLMVQITTGTTLAGVIFYLSSSNTYTGGKAVYG